MRHVDEDAPLLARTGGGMMWVAALLAALLPIDRLVRPDREAGVPMSRVQSAGGITKSFIPQPPVRRER